MAPVIIAKDLYKCYAGFSPVLRGVNIEVEAGELVAIMGPSGCGKSTMLHVLGMLHAPDSGTLEILGTNVLEFNREQTAAFRRGNMGFVMQSSNMFDHSTVFENVEFPLIYENVPPAERWERVIRALELVRLSARVHYRSNRLSGGEQQRVAIARAMVNNPRILLADEPTGALDARTSRVVMDNFRTLCHKGGVAMIMVTHDPKMAEFGDSVYTLEDGILVCKKHEPVPVSPDQQQNLLAAPTPILRGALVAEKFPEASGRCLMEEAHRMHAAGLLSRIYAIEGASFLNSDSQGYALPLPVRHISSWRFFSVMRMLFSHLRGTSATAWELWKSIPSGKGSFFHNLWLMGCGALLARWCLEEKIEFVYASGAHAPASAAWVAARMLQIPFAFAVRTADLASPAKDWLVKAEQAAFVRCDTEATRKAVCELLPSVDPRRIVLLRDALTLTPPDEDVSMPPSNVPEPLQLLAVGTMTSRKGYDTLLQACLALQKAGVDFRLTLVGTGPWRLRLRLLAWRLGLRKLVSFPGQLPHEAMTDLYRRPDIFIAPGHMTRGGDMDGLPSALTEAMAFGVAVVVSDLPGQLEVVQNGRNGIVVPQNDVTALSQTLLDLSASAEKRRHLGAEAWKRIREVLDEEATEARLTSLFKAACHR